MTFQEIYNAVVELTRRPDLEGRTKQAIRSATLKAHHSDFYYRDLVEHSVEFEEPAYIQNFLPTEISTRFRKAKYIRQWHGDVTGGPGFFLEHIQIENSIDEYDYIKTNVYYLAGQFIQIRTTVPLHRCLFGFYEHPNITETEYKSWIATDVPYAIIYGACRTIMKGIGFAEEAREFDQLTAEEFTNLRMSYVDDTPLT